MTDCVFVNAGKHARSLDPWCETHKRSAICCQRESVARIGELERELQMVNPARGLGTIQISLGPWIVNTKHPRAPLLATGTAVDAAPLFDDDVLDSVVRKCIPDAVEYDRFELLLLLKPAGG